MKLMIVTPYFHPSIGGLKNYVYNICKVLVESRNPEAIADSIVKVYTGEVKICVSMYLVGMSMSRGIWRFIKG